MTSNSTQPQQFFSQIKQELCSADQNTQLLALHKLQDLEHCKNLSEIALQQQFQQFLQSGIVPQLIRLAENSIQLKHTFLDALQKILSLKQKKIAQLFNSTGGLILITKTLKNGDNELVLLKCFQLLETYVRVSNFALSSQLLLFIMSNLSIKTSVDVMWTMLNNGYKHLEKEIIPQILKIGIAKTQSIEILDFLEFIEQALSDDAEVTQESSEVVLASSFFFKMNDLKNEACAVGCLKVLKILAELDDKETLTQLQLYIPFSFLQNLAPKTAEFHELFFEIMLSLSHAKENGSAFAMLVQQIPFFMECMEYPLMEVSLTNAKQAQLLRIAIQVIINLVQTKNEDVMLYMLDNHILSILHEGHYEAPLKKQTFKAQQIVFEFLLKSIQDAKDFAKAHLFGIKEFIESFPKSFQFKKSESANWQNLSEQFAQLVLKFNETLAEEQMLGLEGNIHNLDSNIIVQHDQQDLDTLQQQQQILPTKIVLKSTTTSHGKFHTKKILHTMHCKHHQKSFMVYGKKQQIQTTSKIKNYLSSEHNAAEEQFEDEDDDQEEGGGVEQDQEQEQEGEGEEEAGQKSGDEEDWEDADEDEENLISLKSKKKQLHSQHNEYDDQNLDWESH